MKKKYMLLTLLCWGAIVVAAESSSIAMMQMRIQFLEKAIQSKFYFSHDISEGDFFITPPLVSRSGWAAKYIAYDLGFKSDGNSFISRIYVDDSGIIRSFSIPGLKRKINSLNIQASVGVIWYEIVKDVNNLWIKNNMRDKFRIDLEDMIYEVTFQPSFSRFICNRVG